jgi:hypothetical protein
MNNEMLSNKKKKEKEFKEDMGKQAAMWDKERDLWQQEEKRIQDKIKKINAENVEYLKQQEAQKHAGKTKKMAPTEKQLNKGLMREIKQKQRALKEQMDLDSVNERSLM